MTKVAANDENENDPIELAIINIATNNPNKRLSLRNRFTSYPLPSGNLLAGEPLGSDEWRTCGFPYHGQLGRATAPPAVSVSRRSPHRRDEDAVAATGSIRKVRVAP